LPVLLSGLVFLEPFNGLVLEVLTKGFVCLSTGIQAGLQALPPLEKGRDYEIQVMLATYEGMSKQYTPIRTNFFQLE
jgi:hypothetical protein